MKVVTLALPRTDFAIRDKQCFVVLMMWPGKMHPQMKQKNESKHILVLQKKKTEKKTPPDWMCVTHHSSCTSASASTSKQHFYSPPPPSLWIPRIHETRGQLGMKLAWHKSVTFLRLSPSSYTTVNNVRWEVAGEWEAGECGAFFIQLYKCKPNCTPPLQTQTQTYSRLHKPTACLVNKLTCHFLNSLTFTIN